MNAPLVCTGFRKTRIVQFKGERNANLTKYCCYPCSMDFIKCLRCGGNLHPSSNLVPISEDRYVEIEGKICSNCNAFYTRNKKLLYKAIKVSPEKSLFTIDDCFDVLLITVAGERKVAYLMGSACSGTTIYNCFTSSSPLSSCFLCGGGLENYTNPIPISGNRFIKIYGQACRNCKAFFTWKKELLHDAIDLCWSSSEFTIDNRCCVNYLQDLSSALMQITVYRRNDVGDVRTYTIVDLRRQSNLHENILHITNAVARALLTAVLLRDKDVKIDGDLFTIKQTRYRENNSGGLSILKPDVFVEVKRNGGYYAPGVELLDGLVFCEKTRCLEILQVSYDREDDIYYVDGQKYEEFRRKFGYPIVHYVSQKSGNGLIELQQESLLHQLGYNVSSKENLSNRERHEILGSCVDFGFMDVRSIVNLLNSLIHRNGAWNPQCIPKWHMDLEYIQNYKVNPERSVFIQKIRRL